MKKFILFLFLTSSILVRAQSPEYLHLVKNTNNLYNACGTLRLPNGTNLVSQYLTAGLASTNLGGFICFNSSGNIVWHKTIEDYYPIQMVENGGSVYSVGSNFHTYSSLAKTNINNGNVIWSKSISNTNALFINAPNVFSIFKEAINSNAVFYSRVDNNETYYTLLCKLDANGNSTFSKRIDSIYPVSVVQNGAGYLLLGKRGWQPADTAYYLVNLDVNMNTIWSTQMLFPIATQLGVGGIQNNAIYLDGINASGKAVLTKLDLNGVLKWSKAYSTTEPFHKGHTFGNVIYKSNHLYVLGYSQDSAYAYSNTITTLDTNGIFVKNRVNGYNSGFSYIASHTNPDTSVYSVGAIDANPGNNYLMYEMQFDLDGDLGACIPDSLIMQDFDFIPTFSTPPIFTPITESVTLIPLTTSSNNEVPYLEGIGTRIDSIVPTLPNCSDVCSGTETVYYSGLDFNPTITWSLNAGGQTGSFISNLCVGTYFVTLTDVYGCVDTASSVLNYMPPATPEICAVTVDDMSTHNIIFWDKTNFIATGIDSFKIYREDVSNIYTHIGSVAFDSLSEYHDFGADPNVTTKRYKLSMIDTCGIESGLSPYHNTIYITYSGLGQYNWNPQYLIEGSPSPVTQYLLFRDDNSTGTFNQVASTAGTQFQINDPAFASFPNGSWRVETDWSISCLATRGAINTSRSNIKSPTSVIGLNEVKNHIGFSFSPNPATEQIVVRTNENKNTFFIEVYNMLGQKVLEKSSDAKETILDVSSLNAGSYFIKVQSEKGTSTQKLIKN